MHSSTPSGPTTGATTADEVAAYLLAGQTVQLVGRHGSGRSRTARRVGDLLGDAGVTAVHLPGLRALRDRSLAAAAVSGLGLVPPGSVPAPSVAADALVDQLGGRPCVLVVDDADDLDAVTSGVVLAARRRADVPVLAVGLPGARTHAPTGLLAAGLAPGVRVELEPLRFAQVHSLVHEMLPGLVDPVVVARLATRSGGLPGLVRAVVEEARRTGGLRVEGALWREAGDLWSPRLAPVLEALLDGLRDDERDALAVLSVARTAPLPRALELVPRDALTCLEELGLVRLREGRAEPVVVVSPPMLAEHLRRTAPVLEVRRIRALLLPAAPDRRVPAPGVPLPHAPHPYDAAPPSDAPPTPAAAAASPQDATTTLVAQRPVDHWQDEVAVLRRLWERDRRPGTAGPLLAALHHASASRAEVEDVLARTPRDGDDPQARALVAAWEAMFRALRFDQPDRARARLVAARAGAAGLEPFLRAVQAHLDLVRGSAPDPTLLQEAGPDGHPLSVQAVTAVQVERDLAAGRVGSATARLRDLRATLPTVRHHGDVCHGLALVLGGEVACGVAWARERLTALRDGAEAGPMQSHWYVLALGLTLLGRFDELDECVHAALASTHVLAIQRHYQGGLLSLAAVVAAWQGRPGYARTLAMQGSALGAGQGPFPAMIPGALLALTDGGDDVDQADVLWRTARHALDGGYVAAGALCAAASVELKPDPGRAAVVEDAARGADSPLVLAWTQYVLAAAHGDVQALAAASVALDRAGTPLYSVRALVTRALALRERDDAVAARAQADAAWVAAGERGVDRRGLFTRLVRSVNLTARESEVAELVSAQRPNAEIARTLGLSTRTVETHLMNTHRKVGVDNRDDLAHAVRTWLTRVP